MQLTNKNKIFNLKEYYIYTKNSLKKNKKIGLKNEKY